MMSRRTSVKAEFRKISSIKLGSEVFFNGFLVGKVDNIYLKKDQSKMIVVDFSFNPGVKIPITAQAVSYVPSPLAEAYLVINFDTTRSYDLKLSEDWLSEGDVIPGVIGSYLMDIRNYADPIIKKIDTLVLQAFPGKDSIRQILNDIEASITLIENSSTAFRVGMSENEAFVLDLMQKIEDISLGIENSADSINFSIDKLVVSTNNFKNMDIVKLIPNIDPNAFKTPDFNKINTQISGIKNRLARINSGQDSTLARLLYDKDYKIKIKNQIAKLERTLDTIRISPERYVSMKKKKTN